MEPDDASRLAFWLRPAPRRLAGTGPALARSSRPPSLCGLRRAASSCVCVPFPGRAQQCGTAWPICEYGLFGVPDIKRAGYRKHFLSFGSKRPGKGCVRRKKGREAGRAPRPGTDMGRRGRASPGFFFGHRLRVIASADPTMAVPLAQQRQKVPAMLYFSCRAALPPRKEGLGLRRAGVSSYCKSFSAWLQDRWKTPKTLSVPRLIHLHRCRGAGKRPAGKRPCLEKNRRALRAFAGPHQAAAQKALLYPGASGVLDPENPATRRLGHVPAAAPPTPFSSRARPPSGCARRARPPPARTGAEGTCCTAAGGAGAWRRPPAPPPRRAPR